MGRDGFDTKELNDLLQGMMRLAEKTFPEETDKFMKEQGNKGRRMLRANYRSGVGKKTGNLVKGVNKSRVQKRKDGFQVRLYNKAPHAHLIEHGHYNEKTKASSGSQGKIQIGTPVVMVPGKDGPLFIGDPSKEPEKKFVKGMHIAAKTTNQLKRTFPEDADKFIDELIEKGF